MDQHLACEKPEPLTFAELGNRLRGQPFSERDLEDLLRKQPDLLTTSGEETLLIIGQQVTNLAGGRADLVAVDGSGALVLIEIKRDSADAVRRTEPFEWQALRYAASYALIGTPDDAASRLFTRYITQHASEFSSELGQLTAEELARRKLSEFLRANAVTQFNHRQRIVLVASSFDPQVLSACAWLAANGVPIRCIAVEPQEIGEEFFLSIETVLPPPELRDFYVDVRDHGTSLPSVRTDGDGRTAISRSYLPRMNKLLEWQLVRKGESVFVKNAPEHKAVVLDEDTVEYGGHRIGYNEWAKLVTGWSAVNVYEWTVHEPSGKTLDELRREYLARQAASQEDTRTVLESSLPAAVN